ncbi:MFS transporter [Kitasatospora cineracea]|uniref:MFS transporter n=1 Tax=Kitasatospora cineracea TaxID=88074 RepID=UPI003433F6BB
MTAAETTTGADAEAAAGVDGTARKEQRPRLGGEFGKLWTAATASAIGDGMSLTAAPLLAGRLTDDPRLIGGVTVALTVPYVLFGLPAGVLADRVDLRRAMVRIDFFRAALVALLACCVLFGRGQLPVLYLCLFLIGSCETFFRNAAQVLLPSVLREEALVDGNGRLMAAQTAGSEFLGPLVGAALFGLGAALPFGLDALTFLVSAVLLSRLRTAPAAPDPAAGAAPRPSLLADMATGARWLWNHRLLRSLAGLAAVVNLVSTGGLAVLVVHAHRVLGLGDFGYGVLLACQAAGAVLAAKVAPELARRAGREWALVATAAMLVLGNALIWLVPSAWAVATALALDACAGVTWNVVVVVLRQTVIPTGLQGRVNSVYRLVAWGAMPVGAALAGTVAASAGTPPVYGLGAAVMAAVGVRMLYGVRTRWISGTGAAA